MIEVDIINSSDHNRVGRYTFQKNKISFGSGGSDELLESESNIIPEHINFEIVDSKIFLNIHNNVDYVLVNNKRTTAKKFLKAGDVITILSSQIKLITFSKNIIQTRKDFLNNQVEQIKENSPELLSVLRSIDV